MKAALTRPALVADLAGILREVTGEDRSWASRVGPGSRLEGDLGLDSVELAAFAGCVRDSYGVDLAGIAAGLDIDQLIALTVGDLADWVGEWLRARTPSGGDG